MTLVGVMFVGVDMIFIKDWLVWIAETKLQVADTKKGWLFLLRYLCAKEKERIQMYKTFTLSQTATNFMDSQSYRVPFFKHVGTSVCDM